MTFVFRGAADVDVTGAVPIAVEEGSYPCRRCLTDAVPGDEVVLVSYDPFDSDSPYRCSSPVFVHAHACSVHVGTTVPEQQRRRLLSVRSFDDAAMMIDADVVDGTDLEQVLERMFTDPHARYAHVHNARPGCFAVRVDRGV